MTRILLIPASLNRPVEAFAVGRGTESILASFQRLVGGLIIPVPLLSATMYANEKDGALPTNWRATNLLWEEVPSRAARTLGGSIILVGPLDAEGYDTDAPEKYRERFQV